MIEYGRMSTTTEIVDPAEFVQSFTAAKYQRVVDAWSNTLSPGCFINALASAKAPKAVYVEICLAFADEILSVFEEKHPEDFRPRRAVEAARAWLENRTTANEEAARKAAGEASLVAFIYCDDNTTRAATWATWATANTAGATFSYAAYNAVQAVIYAIGAGIPQQHLMDIIRDVVHRYYAFLSLC